MKELYGDRAEFTKGSNLTGKQRSFFLALDSGFGLHVTDCKIMTIQIAILWPA